ncbi:MAG TPA: hypothetical protein VK386_10435 [Acidimicrobiales bacterium]|nr:hypothetical protein [Acidimicrobiales bacterium]
MNLVLTSEQAEELQDVLSVAVRELTHEIAATDNAGYRATLQKRRHVLAEMDEMIGRVLALPVTATDTGEALERELSRAGD